MLDPLSALSLASAIVQLVDFSIKLVTNGYELYEKGSLKVNDEIEQATEDLVHLTHELAISTQPNPGQDGSRIPKLSKNEIGLQQLAETCKSVGEELLSILKSMKSHDKQNGLESFRKALGTIRKKGKAKDIEKRLTKLQGQLAFHLLTIMNDKQSRLNSCLDDLREECRRNGTTVSSKIDSLTSKICSSLERLDETVKAARGQRTVFVEVASMCENLANESRKVSTSQRVIKSLYFKSIRMREIAIKKAHAQTFKWIFQPITNESGSNTCFRSWMQSGGGIFWLAGKAGSGKSTLIKFLCMSEKTKELLQEWAGATKLVMPSYYFWSAGNDMQKSQEGLLQTILFQIFKECETLIPRICPERWKDAQTSGFSEQWTYEELSEALSKISGQPQLGVKFCFFVDGLDEYSGEHEEIIKTLKYFAKSDSIKLCVSSRPWNVFQKAFGRDNMQTLLLQEFTKTDIKLYVENSLKQDETFVELATKDASYTLLVQEIVDKAQGVFLWVYLVVRSLLKGLTDENDISTLQLRLRHLPSDLETYFSQILNSIEDVYQSQTAQIFQIMNFAHGSMPSIALSFLQIEETDPDYALTMRVGPLPRERIVEIQDRTRVWINARCKDLVEVTNHGDEQSLLEQQQVNFLHRTVRDFLTTKDMQELLRARIPFNFDARLTICKMMLVYTKISFDNSLDLTWHVPLRKLLQYAREVENFNDISHIRLLDEAADIYLLAENKVSVVNKKQRNLNKISKEFLLMAIAAGLLLYMHNKLDETPSLARKNSSTMLLSAWGMLEPAKTPAILHPEAFSTYPAFNLNVEMTRLLLEEGADPNQPSGIVFKETIWQYFLRKCYVGVQLEENSIPIRNVVILLLKYGADRKILVEVPNLSHRQVPSFITGGGLWRSSLTSDKRTSFPLPATEVATACEILRQCIRPADLEEIEQFIARIELEEKAKKHRLFKKMFGKK